MVSRFIQVAWLIVKKDLTIEARSRELFLTTLFFAASCVLVFAFGFVSDQNPIGEAAAGILWIAIAFAGTLALGRAFERERYHDVLHALLLAPADRPAIYIGKLLGVICLLAIVEIIIVPLISLFFQTPILRHPWLLGGLLACGTLGFASVGTLFAAMLGTCCYQSCCIQSQYRSLLLEFEVRCSYCNRKSTWLWYALGLAC